MKAMPIPKGMLVFIFSRQMIDRLLLEVSILHMIPEERYTTEAVIKDQIDAAVDRIPADLLVYNVKILDVFTETFFPGAVMVKHGKIVNIDPGFVPRAARTYDGKGRYLIPGFIDPCTHIDCSLVTPQELSEGYVPWGTTTVVAEVNDLGASQGENCVPAIKSYFWDRDRLPYRLLGLAPAKHIRKEDTYELLAWENISGQGENAGPTTLAADPDSIEKALNTRNQHIFMNGDVEPFSTPDEIGAFAVCGSVNDHEAWTYDAVFQRHRRGIPTQILYQQGDAQIRYMIEELILNRRLPTENFMFAGDNTYIDDMVNTGILNTMVSKAIELGLSPIKAIKMATLNTAKNLGLDQLLGSIAPGRYADFMLLDSLTRITPSAVFKGGELVAEDGVLLQKPRIDYSFFQQPRKSDMDGVSIDALLAAFSVKESDIIDGVCSADVISLNLDGSDSADAIRTFPDGSCLIRTQMPVVNGRIQSDTAQGIHKVLLVGRESVNGHRRVATCFVKGYGFNSGAMAMTNIPCGNCILAMGVDETDMYAAMMEANRYPGGIAFAEQGETLFTFELSLAGMMSPLDGRMAAAELNKLTELLRIRGSATKQPLVHFWTLAFACQDVQAT